MENKIRNFRCSFKVSRIDDQIRSDQIGEPNENQVGERQRKKLNLRGKGELHITTFHNYSHAREIGMSWWARSCVSGGR